MRVHRPLFALAAAAFGAAVPHVVLAQVAAQATPAPNKVTVSGRARAYDFQRVNHVQNASNPNRTAFGLSAEPYLQYRLGDSPFTFGYSYGASTGFGFNGPNPAKNGKVDNTLPGYPLNQPLHEAYLEYRDKNAYAVVGNQELNYSWLPISDSRLLPVSYQGADVALKLGSTVTFGLTRVTAWESRNSSAFEPNTLLTAPYTGATLDAYHPYTPGTLREALAFKPDPRFSLDLENYQFYDIADLAYGEARYSLAPKSSTSPTVALQYAHESSLGTNQIGNVENDTFGAQLGASPAKNLTLTAATDVAPVRYAIVRAGSATAAEAGYFVGGGGTGDAVAVGPGLYRVAYGGLASPYSDSYATDPLYTTSISQGMVDRRSAGESYKVAATYYALRQQLRFIASQAWYQYSNDVSRNLTSEYDLDGTYYFNKVKKGPYKGFLVRVRYASRTQLSIPYNFQYQRFQTEYDF